MLKVVLDTNVLVSALLKDRGLPAFILALVRRKRVVLCLSEDILEEYEEVLKRERFRAIRDEALSMIAALRKEASWIKPKIRFDDIAGDPDDNKFLDCAYSAQADYLITGNTKHFPIKEFHRTRIVNPREFIESTIHLLTTLN